MSNTLSLDNNDGLIFERMLEHIEQKAFKIKYPNLTARTICTTNYNVSNAAATYTTRTYDDAGNFEPVHNLGTLGTISNSATEDTWSIASYATTMFYTLQEIRSCIMAGINLPSLQLAAARRAWEVKLDRIFYEGDSTTNILGIFNNPNIPVTFSSPGVSGSSKWADKTSGEILTDLKQFINSISEVTMGVHRTNTVVITYKMMNLLTERVLDNTSQTLLTHMENVFPHVRFIQAPNGIDRLASSAIPGTTTLIALESDPSIIQILVPQEFELLPPVLDGLAYRQVAHARTGGAVIHSPKALALLSNI